MLRWVTYNSRHGDLRLGSETRQSPGATVDQSKLLASFARNERKAAQKWLPFSGRSVVVPRSLEATLDSCDDSVERHLVFNINEFVGLNSVDPFVGLHDIQP